MFIAKEYKHKKNILFSFSSTKKVVVKNVQHSIFANPFFIHFYFFFIYNQTSSNTFFFFLVFLFVCLFVYCCAFILVFPLFFLPCILVSIFYTFYVSLCFIFFSRLCNTNTRYSSIYWKNYLSFSFKKKKRKIEKKKRYYDIKSNCCVIFTRSSTCVYRHIKNNKDRSILSVKWNAVTLFACNVVPESGKIQKSIMKQIVSWNENLTNICRLVW